MRNGRRRKWWGVLACGTAIVFLAASTAGADDKTLEELKARLDRLEKRNDRLEKQNEDLRKQLDTVPTAAPYKAEDPPKDKEKERVNKLIDAYMKDKEKKKKEADDKKKREEQEVGHEVGSLLKGVRAEWDDYHLWFRTADNSFAFRLMGWSDFDNTAVDGPQRMFVPLANNGIGKFDDGVNFRRIRLNSSGTFYDQYDFMMEFDYSLGQRVAMPGNPVTVTSTAPGTTASGTISSQAGTVADRLNMVGVIVPTDLWGQIRGTPIGNLRFGNIKPMYSAEQLQSSRFVDFLEFSYIWDAFLEQGNNGWIPSAAVWGNWGDLNGEKNRGFYGAQVGWSNNRELYVWNEADGNLEVTARVGWTIFDECEGSKLLNLCVGSMHQTANNGVLRYRARFDLRDGNNAEQPTLAQIQGGLSDAWLVQPELFFNWGSFNLTAEWAWLACAQNAGGLGFTAVGNQTSNLAPLGNKGELYYTGGYVAVGYFLTGETRAFDRTWKVLDRVVPIENAFCRQDGCWNFGRGAWEVLARYNYLNLDSKGVNGGVLNGIVLGVNWYLNPKCRFMVDYAMDHRGATQYPVTPTSNSPSGWLYGVGARFHVDF